MAYGDFKNLAKRAGSVEGLRDKAFNIAKNSKHDGYERGLASMIYNFFGKKILDSGVNNEIKQNQQLTEEEFILHLKTIFGVLIYLICN